MSSYDPGWPAWAILANAVLAGCTSGGYTGVAYAECAALGGTRRTEATGLDTPILFAGSIAVPPVFGSAVTAMGGYRLSYAAGGLSLRRPGTGAFAPRAPQIVGPH